MTTMSELSPRARQVLQSSVKRATPADRERIQKALSAKLGVATLSAADSTGVPPARPRWPFISSAIVGVGLIGGALFLIARHQPESAGTPPPAVTSAVTVGSAAPVAVPPVESDPVLSQPVPAAPDVLAPSARPAPDRLAQELAFLEHATSALHAGRASNALKILDDYQRKFPNGVLGLERSAARAQALCSLGRQSEAQAELARLPAKSPGVARAKQVCDASSKVQP